MAKVGDTERIDVHDNEGEVGADNDVDITGGLGKNVAIGNTTDVEVKGKNAPSGKIGSVNDLEIKRQLDDGTSVGNTGKVKVGKNSGAIGSENRINIH